MIFIKKLQRRIAQTSIGSSSLRNQGASNVLSSARKSLEGINLKDFHVYGGGLFRRKLDEATSKIQQALPPNAKNWGAARKAINLFLRDVVYNKELVEAYDLLHIKKWLEIPLDKDVAYGLRNTQEGISLPKWPRIKNLSPTVSAQYQSVARKVALTHKLNRVDLDLIYWRPDT